MTGLPRASRWALIAAKAKALAALAARRPATMQVGSLLMAVETTNDVGTIQSSICDVHDDVLPDVFDTDSPVVIDVGANIGQFSSAVLLFAPAATVLAIEPDPVVHDRLAANLAGAQGVRTSCSAAGAVRGVLPLGRAALAVMSTLRQDALSGYDIVGSVDVQVERLDVLAEAYPAVDLLKIDVEGFEIEALQGSHELLTRTRFLLIELGLGRDPARPNLDVLAAIREVCPRSRIVRFGRALGDPDRPLCQDVLLELWPS
ncbi:MAG: FkbM family methyltransferase [Knoellia sp.]